MTGYDKKYGIIKYNNNLYKSYAVFEKGVFYKRNELNDLTQNVKDKEGQIKKFFVPDIEVNCGSEFKQEDLQQEHKKYERYYKNLNKYQIDKTKIHKNRYYLKIVKNGCEIETNDNILTFILFNSSYANQFKLDPTIQNCAYLAFKNGYDGFEIFNLFSIRNSVNKLEDSAECDENINFIVKKLSKKENPEIILAWGYGNQQKCPQRVSLLLSKINNKNLKQISTRQDKRKMMHPDNRGWNRIQKTFKDNAIITDFNQKDINNDKIK